MSDAPLPTRAEEAREYVLIKRGLYWRPNGQGYTGLLSEAGRYSADIAAAHEFNDGRSTRSMLASEAAEFAPACWEETKLACRTKERDDAEARAARAEAEVARLTERVAVLEGALKPFINHYAKWMDDWDADVPCNSFARVTFGQLRAARAALHGGDQ